MNAWDDSLNVAKMIANGKFYSTSISGVINCYDVKDGTPLWTYEAKDPYGEETHYQLVAAPNVPHQRLRILSDTLNTQQTTHGQEADLICLVDDQVK